MDYSTSEGAGQGSKPKRVTVLKEEGLTSWGLSQLIAEKVHLGKGRKAVLRAMADHYPNIFPSMGVLGAEAGIGERQARRNVNQLERMGVVTLVGPRCVGHVSRQYRLNVPIIMAWAAGNSDPDESQFKTPRNPDILSVFKKDERGRFVGSTRTKSQSNPDILSVTTRTFCPSNQQYNRQPNREVTEEGLAAREAADGRPTNSARADGNAGGSVSTQTPAIQGKGATGESGPATEQPTTVSRSCARCGKGGVSLFPPESGKLCMECWKAKPGAAADGPQPLNCAAPPSPAADFGEMVPEAAADVTGADGGGRIEQPMDAKQECSSLADSLGMDREARKRLLAQCGSDLEAVRDTLRWLVRCKAVAEEVGMTVDSGTPPDVIAQFRAWAAEHGPELMVRVFHTFCHNSDLMAEAKHPLTLICRKKREEFVAAMKLTEKQLEERKLFEEHEVIRTSVKGTGCPACGGHKIEGFPPKDDWNCRECGTTFRQDGTVLEQGMAAKRAADLGLTAEQFLELAAEARQGENIFMAFKGLLDRAESGEWKPAATATAVLASPETANSERDLDGGAF